ncbi:Na-translocating system protein MpsC family protein [Planococcus lenghuensis]|uniref:Na+-translocating membrane potential-generating system MpsC domain-containing protein n=1 Tax=Planococcus lenghuensis TaxID=2213202 RepID=A0A1Q2KVC4_9BACL|nr:Na-translocating system protein MpsC family protein [Planococcus lenghuensis]AQQ52178.1 hypothetical protein B0X71_02985 [Planococcus lenghuensis]
MSKEKTLESQVSGYISTVLREHFGKGPSSVFINIKRPFITIHIRGFLSPTESVLIKKQEHQKVAEVRDLLMNDIRTEIQRNLWKLTKLDIKDIYTDWDFDKETGLILGVMDETLVESLFDWPGDVDKQAFIEEIDRISKKGQKLPESTHIYWLNDRTILVLRTGVLVRIEKELIRNGYTEQLQLTKRPMEYKLIDEADLEPILKRKIADSFVNWDFVNNIGYTVLVLEAKQK